MTAFVLLNQCADPDLKPELLQRISAALDVQLNRDVATYWGGSYRVRAASPDNPPAPGEVVCLIVDDLPEAPGAIAYHGWEGKPNVYAARNMCSGLVTGSFSLSSALSHELCETAGDEACNLWADDGTGGEWARELCDAVEARSYVIDEIPVSDFVLPAYFEPGTLGPYAYVQAHGSTEPFGPFLLLPGGYGVKRTSGGGETSVWGSMRASRAGKIAHWSSRTYQRLHSRG